MKQRQEEYSRSATREPRRYRGSGPHQRRLPFLTASLNRVCWRGGCNTPPVNNVLHTRLTTKQDSRLGNYFDEVSRNIRKHTCPKSMVHQPSAQPEGRHFHYLGRRSPALIPEINDAPSNAQETVTMVSTLFALDLPTPILSYHYT